MPFTFSHAAIVLPLAKTSKRYWSLTGLVVGSMAPDLEYFSRMKILATYGHLWLDGLWFNILISLIYCFVFHLLVRNVLIDHLPKFLKSRLVSFTKFNWIKHFKDNWLVILISINIGIYSHLFWDAFTHEWGYFVERISFLRSVWVNIGLEVKGYKFLQYFSSVLGLITIYFWLIKLPKKDIISVQFDYQFWMLIIVFTSIVTLLRFVLFPIEIGLGNLIVVPMMSGFIGLMLAGVYKNNLNKKPQV